MIAVIPVSLIIEFSLSQFPCSYPDLIKRVALLVSESVGVR